MHTLDNSRDDPRWPEEHTGAPHRPPERPEAESSPDEGMADDDRDHRFADLPAPLYGDDQAGFDFDDDIPPPPWPDTARAADGPRRPPGAARIVAFMVVILAGLGIVMTVQSVRLYGRQTQTQATLDASVDRLAAVYGGSEADETGQRRIAWLRKALADGDYAQAQQALASLGKPPVPPRGAGASAPGGPEILGPGEGLPGGGGQLPSPAEAGDLPLEVQRFFSDHDELWQAFFGFTSALVQLRRAGAPTDELEQMRASMVEAARTGQAERVEQLLEQAREKVALGGGAALPDPLRDKLAAFGQAFGRAQREGRDVRRAAELAQRSEAAARAGEFERAAGLLDEATAALRSAPRGRGARAPRPGQAGQRGAPPVGPELGFLRFLSQIFDRVMKTEEADLTRVWESINNAAGAIREHNADQVREILGGAMDAMRSIGARRREMVRTIQQAQEQARAAGPQQGPSEAERRERTEVVLARVEAILARVRELSAEQYEAAKEQIARDLMAALTAPVATSAPPSAAEPELTPEERVRAKMRLAGQMYVQLKASTDADTSGLDERFEEVRRLITEHDYGQAEELLDATVAIMRELAARAEARPPGPGETDLEEATRPHLRGLGEEPIVAPPPPVAPTEQPDLPEESQP